MFAPQCISLSHGISNTWSPSLSTFAPVSVLQSLSIAKPHPPICEHNAHSLTGIACTQRALKQCHHHAALPSLCHPKLHQHSAPLVPSLRHPGAWLTECEHPELTPTAKEPGHNAGAGHYLHGVSSTTALLTWQSTIAFPPKTPAAYCLCGACPRHSEAQI